MVACLKEKTSIQRGLVALHGLAVSHGLVNGAPTREWAPFSDPTPIVGVPFTSPCDNWLERTGGHGAPTFIIINIIYGFSYQCWEIVTGSEAMRG
jgi:hypothetical protein